MNRLFLSGLLAAVILPLGASCVAMDDEAALPALPEQKKQQKIEFPVTVTREGEQIPSKRIATKAGDPGYDAQDNMNATMDTDIPFGIVGVDFYTHELIIDNARVSSNNSSYSGYFDTSTWQNRKGLAFSAYYPYVSNITYEDDLEGYSIPYSVSETEAGPLVSKTVERAINEINSIPFVMQHITNDIGYRICDVTTDPQLQGLIHLRKLTATNVASAGIFVNDLRDDLGRWQRQGYYRNVVVFEGDAVLGVGSSNEYFVGRDDLVTSMRESSRYYSIPDDIEMGKQCVEVIYDVDSFTIGGFTYPAMKNVVGKFMLYGLLPGNVFEYGKQYTFHLGLDTGKLYQQVAFSASVDPWETKIFENNDDF